MPQDTQLINSNVFETHMHEVRVFPPPDAFAAKARLKSMEEYERMYARSVEDPEGFWGDAAGELEWFAPWERVLDESGAHAKWFTGGKLPQLCGSSCAGGAQGQGGAGLGG
jgi:acetyl-CoA synthetase